MNKQAPVRTCLPVQQSSSKSLFPFLEVWRGLSTLVFCCRSLLRMHLDGLSDRSLDVFDRVSALRSGRRNPGQHHPHHHPAGNATLSNVLRFHHQRGGCPAVFLANSSQVPQLVEFRFSTAPLPTKSNDDPSPASGPLDLDMAR
jgi:hypothetical protein